MRHPHLLFLPAVLVTLLPAQVAAREIYQQLAALPKDAASSAALVEAAKTALRQHATVLATGDGLHFRARIQLLARTGWQDAVASYLAHADAVPGPLANDSLVLAAQLVHRPGGDWARAQKLLERVQSDQLGPTSKPTYDSLVIWTKSDGAQAALVGKPAPAFEALKVLNGPEKLSLADTKGKVVLLDFWATW